MAEVYGIFQGEYSDWKCIGYFDDEVSAWKYCNLRNENLSDYDRMYVMPIKKINCDLSHIPDGYFVYQFTFHNRGDLWRLYPDYCHEPDDWDIKERLIEYTSDYFAPYGTEKQYPGCRVAHIRVCVKKADMVKAREIAYQTIHQFFKDGVEDG